MIRFYNKGPKLIRLLHRGIIDTYAAKPRKQLTHKCVYIQVESYKEDTISREILVAVLLQ